MKRQRLTLGTLKQLHAPQLPSPKRCKMASVRFVEWKRHRRYTLIRTAPHTFASTDAIQRTYESKMLNCEQHFCEFRHVDDKVLRTDKLEPRYVAVFRLQDGRYIQPQAKHYRQAYGGRKEKNRAGEILPNGCPYWCCVYGMRIQNEVASKKRYQQRQRAA